MTSTAVPEDTPEGTIVPAANEYDMNYNMMEPLDDIICGKESPFIGPNPTPMTRSASSSVVQAHMTNMAWMNGPTTAHPIHNSHIQPPSHQLHQLKLHPQGPGTPPDTPPGFSPPATSLPPSPPFVPQQTTAIVEEMWTTSYNRYLEPLDLRHGPQLYPDPLEQQPFYVDRKWELVQQRQTQLQMPLMPAIKHQHPQQPHPNQQHPHQQQQQLHLQHHQQPQQPPHQTHHSNNENSNHQELSRSTSLLHISDDDLLSLTVRDLNRRLHSMTKEDQAHIKQRRRTLKNRGYAQSCRYKRQEQKSKLEIENGELKDKISLINQQLNQTSREIESLRKERDQILRENHQLRQQQQQSGNPHQQLQTHQHHNQHQLPGLHNQQQQQQTSSSNLYDI